MKRVVMFSGGVGSWAAAKRVAATHGTDDLHLVFTDTLIEDEDLYRFLLQAAADILGAPPVDDLVDVTTKLPLVEGDEPIENRKRLLRFLRLSAMQRIDGLAWLCEGRTPWEIFRAAKILTHRYDPCSERLKRNLADRWLKDHCNPADTVVYVGIDWTEMHRIERLASRRALTGWSYEAPLCDPPYWTKQDMLDRLADSDIAPPRLYRMGFSHNNCGGFCIKAGHGHYATLLHQMPDRFDYHARQEAELRADLGDHAYILRRQVGDDYTPVTLAQFREESEAGGQCDLFDIGGCGCFTDEGDEP